MKHKYAVFFNVILRGGKHDKEKILHLFKKDDYSSVLYCIDFGSQTLHQSYKLIGLKEMHDNIEPCRVMISFVR